jgi:hypothetical protein
MKPGERRLAVAWDSYAKLIPSDASAVQLQETRRAFYAGAVALFYTVATMLDEGQEPTEADLAKMDDLKAELDAWAQDVKEGRA